MITKVNWVEQLLNAVPEFTKKYEHHLALYEEVLPYILMGQVAALASEAYQQGQQDILDHVLNFVNEAAKTGDDEVKGMLQVSFLWRLRNSPGYSEIKPRLNPAVHRLIAEEAA